MLSEPRTEVGARAIRIVLPKTAYQLLEPHWESLGFACGDPTAEEITAHKAGAGTLTDDADATAADSRLGPPGAPLPTDTGNDLPVSCAALLRRLALSSALLTPGILPGP